MAHFHVGSRGGGPIAGPLHDNASYPAPPGLRRYANGGDMILNAIYQVEQSFSNHLIQADYPFPGNNLIGNLDVGYHVFEYQIRLITGAIHPVSAYLTRYLAFLVLEQQWRIRLEWFLGDIRDPANTFREGHFWWVDDNTGKYVGPALTAVPVATFDFESTIPGKWPRKIAYGRTAWDVAAQRRIAGVTFLRSGIHGINGTPPPNADAVLDYYLPLFADVRTKPLSLYDVTSPININAFFFRSSIDSINPTDPYYVSSAENYFLEQPYVNCSFSVLAIRMRHPNPIVTEAEILSQSSRANDHVCTVSRYLTDTPVRHSLLYESRVQDAPFVDYVPITLRWDVQIITIFTPASITLVYQSSAGVTTSPANSVYSFVGPGELNEEGVYPFSFQIFHYEGHPVTDLPFPRSAIPSPGMQGYVYIHHYPPPRWFETNKSIGTQGAWRLSNFGGVTQDVEFSATDEPGRYPLSHAFFQNNWPNPDGDPYSPNDPEQGQRYFVVWRTFFIRASDQGFDGTPYNYQVNWRYSFNDGLLV